MLVLSVFVNCIKEGDDILWGDVGLDVVTGSEYKAAARHKLVQQALGLVSYTVGAAKGQDILLVKSAPEGEFVTKLAFERLSDLPSRSP